MILLDRPYVSDFLLHTLENIKIPVIMTNSTSSILGKNKIVRISEEDAVNNYKKGNKRLLTNSENSIFWVNKNLKFSKLPELINIFKDKLKFRNLLMEIYPDFFFETVKQEDLQKLDITKIRKPFIIKPSVGFFSLGVHKVLSDNDWVRVVREIKIELKSAKKLYPTEVLDTSTFIIEECIDGEEFAVDCYFDEFGKPVILNILSHSFASENDVSDRIYLSSDQIIRTNFNLIKTFLELLGTLVELNNFPMHLEVRINEKGRLIPIEINPLRFGGWCTTADFSWYSYGINSYEYFFKGKYPDWQKILSKRKDFVYALIVLDNKTSISGNKIKSFNYDKLLNHFENPLELRKIDYQKFPLFGFLFVKTRKLNINELNRILNSDLMEFINIE